MRALVELLGKVCTRRESGVSLALFRLLLSAATLYSLALIAQADSLDAIWVNKSEGGIFTLTTRHWLYDVIGGHNQHSVHQLYYVCWITALFSLLGFGGRISILACQQCYVALRNLNANASGGYDSLIVLGLLLLACSRPTETLSLDCWLTRKRWTSSTLLPGWPRALLVFQILLMYSMTGLQKIGYSWTPMGGYTALHYVLNDPTWLRFDLGTTPWLFSFMLRIVTAVTWHWEQTSLLLLLHWYFRLTDAGPQWLRRVFTHFDLRKPWAAIGIGMHLAILVLLDVGPFSLVSLAYYVCLWSPDEWLRTFRRLSPRT